MNNRIKTIMIGTDRTSFGGMSSVIKLYSESGLLGDNVIYLSSYKDGSVLFKMVFFGVFLIKYLFLLLTDKKIKLIHIHTATKGSFFRKSIALIVAKVFNKKVLLHVHAAEFNIFYDKSPSFIKQFITKILDKSDVIIALSNQWKADICEKTTNPNIKVLYNPAIIKDFKSRLGFPTQHNKFDNALSATWDDYKENSTVNVLFMGRLGKRKGTYDIIEAAKYLKTSDVEIHLYGDGDVEEFENIIADNNLQEKVKINGWISGDKKAEVFQSADIYILPSYNEGLPISILEAMALGLPIISTPVGGIPEAVKDGINGFLVQVGDYKALAEKIDLLAGEKSLREQMGIQSHKIAKEKFDIEIIMKQLQNLYAEILEK